jgi:hypothetical protein
MSFFELETSVQDEPVGPALPCAAVRFGYAQ